MGAQWVRDDAWSRCEMGGREMFVLQLVGFVDFISRGAYGIGMGFWQCAMFALSECFDVTGCKGGLVEIRYHTLTLHTMECSPFAHVLIYSSLRWY